MYVSAVYYHDGAPSGEFSADLATLEGQVCIHPPRVFDVVALHVVGGSVLRFVWLDGKWWHGLKPINQSIGRVVSLHLWAMHQCTIPPTVVV